MRVALVCMPFAMADRPSIQVGLLAAIARKVGFETDTFHLNLNLAALIPDAYDGLCAHRGHMTGEWLFSIAAFGDAVDQDDEAYFAAFPEELSAAARGGKGREDLSRWRHELLPRFVDDCATTVDWGQYDVIGFSSTFQQNVASIALATRVKAAHPHTKIVFGGANMEDEMGEEYARAFPVIDHVVVGEGDIAFPALLERLRDGGPTADLPGVTWREGDRVHLRKQETPFEALDDLPTPDYDEYFERRRRLRLPYRKESIFGVLFESSRGCWWGQKHHCTFCGLNGGGMKFRAKRAERTLSELTELSRKHGVTMFQATDNIVDMGYVDALFKRIADSHTDYEFFYETKANLTQEQIRTMRAGGVRWLQPGIESMSTHVLQLMRKGCTALQNLRLLKWCLYYGIRVGWNLLWGFPGEREEDYASELAVLKLIPHLEPPNTCGRIWMERFSPVFFDRVLFPASNVRPEASYAYAYPKAVDLRKAAYFFDYELEDTLPASLHDETIAFVSTWKERWMAAVPPRLSFRRTDDTLFIDDTRDPSTSGTHVFYGPMAALYEHCSATMRTVAQVQTHLSARYGARVSEDELQWGLGELCRRGLMAEEAGRYLALAIPANPNW